MTLHDCTVPAYRDMLAALIGILQIAKTNGGDPLLHAAIAPDMHPLSTQIRFVANMPGEALGKLANADGPHWGQEDPKTLDEGIARLEEVSATLAEVTPRDFAGEDERVTLDLPNGMAFDLSAAEYVREWALPQFYFHMSAAYMILRNRGVPLGKAQYVPHMLRHIKAGGD